MISAQQIYIMVLTLNLQHSFKLPEKEGGTSEQNIQDANQSTAFFMVPLKLSTQLTTTLLNLFK